MSIFLWLMGLYGLPLWFLFRLWYFANNSKRESWRDDPFDGASKTFSVCFVLILSWVGFFTSAGIVSCKKEDLAQTFFIPVRGEKSMAVKIFLYKMRALGLRLIFIKES